MQPRHTRRTRITRTPRQPIIRITATRPHRSIITTMGIRTTVMAIRGTATGPRPISAIILIIVTTIAIPITIGIPTIPSVTSAIRIISRHIEVRLTSVAVSQRMAAAVSQRMVAVVSQRMAAVVSQRMAAAVSQRMVAAVSQRMAAEAAEVSPPKS